MSRLIAGDDSNLSREEDDRWLRNYLKLSRILVPFCQHAERWKHWYPGYFVADHALTDLSRTSHILEGSGPVTLNGKSVPQEVAEGLEWMNETVPSSTAMLLQTSVNDR